jgi:hypothetical protein
VVAPGFIDVHEHGQEPRNYQFQAHDGVTTSLERFCSKWWAVLGSNQWPLPCETGVRGLRINHMRVQFPIATGTWYHVMSRNVTIGLSQNCPSARFRDGRLMTLSCRE